MKTPIHQLRQQGYKVRVIHYRHIEPVTKRQAKTAKLMAIADIRAQKLSPQVWPKGGQTVVQLRQPDGKEAMGVAKCSIKDSYRRAVGINIAVAAALKQLNSNPFTQAINKVKQFIQNSFGGAD